MSNGLCAIVLLMLMLNGCAARAPKEFDATYGNGSRQLVVATGSPGELGLLKVLAEEFSKDNDVAVCWRKAGTGDSLRLLHDRKADVVMVHGPAEEKKAVSEGWAVHRTLIGSNEFYLVGPHEDPAKVQSTNSVAEAFARIARSRAKFFSRADNSGTHKKEMAIWQKTRIVPAGDWYVPTKSFMIASLMRANDERGYFLTDSSTWIACRDRAANLKIVLKGDPFIVNVYHAYRQPAQPGSAQSPAAEFLDFLACEKAQKTIREFGRDRYGEGLYNDADYARKFE
ncbi:MAG: substrate-binding domain-containing protein [Planctomycetaceae bacterium]|nr:substrate-binding domain-containing protein [Planctomycetaceae bacterium]